MTEREPADALVAPEITTSRAQGRQYFSAQRAAHELETERTRHHLTEEVKENQHRRDLERKAFWFILLVLSAALVAGFRVAVEADNASTRIWGQGLWTLIVGGLVGAAGGYATGKRGK